MKHNTGENFMRTKVDKNTVTLWLSAADTSRWASRPGDSWPCSTIAGKRLVAQFDRNGLIDMAIDGDSGADCPGDEFNAITSDFLEGRLDKEHPAYFVAVGQFI